MQPKHSENPHQSAQQPFSLRPRKSSSLLFHSTSASSSDTAPESKKDQDTTVTSSSRSHQAQRQEANQFTSDFKFSGNRQSISQAQDEDISPSSSHSSLAVPFQRTNSAGNSHIQPSLQHKASLQSISSSTSSKSHRISLHPGFALNRLKNSVVQHHRKHQEKIHNTDNIASMPPQQATHHSMEASSTHPIPPPTFNSRFTMPDSETASIYSSKSSHSLTNIPSIPPSSIPGDTINPTAYSSSTNQDVNRLPHEVTSSKLTRADFNAPSAMGNYPGQASTTVELTTNSAVPGDETFPSHFPSRQFVLDDIDISPKPTLFSPQFMVMAQKESRPQNSPTHTAPNPSSIPRPPEPLQQQQQQSQLQAVDYKPPTANPPVSTPSQVKIDEPKQTFLTIQDLQDVSPLSSFSGPSLSSAEADLRANSLNTGFNPSSLESTYANARNPSTAILDRQPSHIDFRRPSYASMITNSSIGSGSRWQEFMEDSGSLHSTSPTSNGTGFNHFTDTEEQDGSSTPLTSITTRSNSRINPMVFPQPDEVFDTKEMRRYTEQRAKAIEDSDNLTTPPTPTSRSESIDSTFIGKPKSKKNFFGKLISRRESSADFMEKGSRKASKEKASDSASKSSWPSGLDPHSIIFRPAAGLISTGRDAIQYVTQSDREPPRQSTSWLRTTTFSKQSKKPEPVIDTPAQQSPTSVPQSPLGTTSSNFYPLDTDLEHMTGIVDGKKSHTPTNSVSNTNLPNVNPSALPGITTDDLGLSEIRTSGTGTTTPGIAIPGPSTTAINTADQAGGWQAPESWNIVPDTAVPHWPSSRESSSSSAQPKSTNKNQKYFVRIFRENGTFGTFSCDIDITVTELIQLLSKKYFPTYVPGYQLTMRTAGLQQILLPKERPLLFQKVLLDFMGYTENDRLAEVGRDDLSYMCRFEFCRLEMRTFNAHEKAIMSRNFSHADMHHLDLQTIPVLYYSHSREIKFLDVSENPSITIPSDFIQACTNLQSIRYVNNRALQFPLNILHTCNLQSLDLSSNLLSHLENVDFSKLSSLVILDLHGNRLSVINESISKLISLECLNISSNVLTEICTSICQIRTLRQLDVSFNKISTLPDEIGLLENLEEFAISNNYLTKKLPDTFVRLKKLNKLDIRYNKLQSIDILSKLPILQTLYCSKNSVSSFSAEFPQLKLFYFDRNPLTKIEFVESHCTLTVLNLSKAKLAVLDETFLEKIPFVEKLVLDKNHLSSLPPHIGSLKRLVYMSIVANNLDSLPPEIGLLHELRHLDLHNNNIRSLPKEIWNLAFLEYLNASSNLLEGFPKHSSQSSSSSTESERIKDFGNLVRNYEMGNTSTSRRPSTLSISSSLGPNERRLSAFPSSTRSTSGTHSRDATIGLRPRRTLAQCLLTLSLSDNRLTDECFEEISWLTELQVLNLSYNDIIDIPLGALSRFSRLTELYLSGNNLTSLPADDIESIQTLRVLHVNSNKLHSLPAELGKINQLTVLDVGSNNLKYNINNWPYDWNWNYNLNLRYLNFSGNRRLEIKALSNQASHFGREPSEKNLSDFTVLNHMRVLGLMDVTLITSSVPDQTENCRVRTYGSEINSMPFGMADSIGHRDNLSVIDMVLERFRGMENEVVIGLFDGRCEGNVHGNKVSKLIQETFGSIFTEELKKLRENETVKDALRRAFLNTNKEIGNTALMASEEIAHSLLGHRSSTAKSLEYSDGVMTGSCATIVYIKKDKLYVANAGDSMAIISRPSGEYTVLTTRHDPTSEAELARIRAGAGVVSSTGQLDDILDVSRAIGFYNLIPHIHAKPSITEYDLLDNGEILIIGSKQLWEYVSYQIALDVVRMSSGDLMKAAAKLRDFAISYGASDKIMVMVIGVGISRRRSKTRIIGSSFGHTTNIGEEELFPAFKKRRDRSLLPEDSGLARLGGEVDPPTNEVALVFTDIKNSTFLWETSPIAMRSAIKVHNSIMRRQLRIIGGYEVKTEGDAFMVSFPTPTSALLWCFSVQSLLLVADWPAEIVESNEGCEVLDDKDEVIFRGLSVRMGIHWGTPVSERDPITRRMDYFGPMVNRAARVSAVADGGQISLSFDFVAEMKRLGDALNQYKTGAVATLAEAFGGEESLGIAIEHDIKMLDNIGWECKELGEEKLKGIENPEFISLAYQKSLIGRYPIHLKRSLQKRSPQPVSSTISTTVSQLQMDMLTQLRNISIRLESVCTRLAHCGTSYGTSGAATKGDIGSRISHITGLPSSMAPCSESDYAVFFSHLITRIENCLSTLYLRVTIRNLSPVSRDHALGVDPSVSNLCGLLSAVLQLSVSGGKNGQISAEMISSTLQRLNGVSRAGSSTSTMVDDGLGVHSVVAPAHGESKSSAELNDEFIKADNVPMHVNFSNHQEFHSAPSSPKLDEDLDD